MTKKDKQDPILETIKNSSNNLVIEVADKFSSAGWDITVSPYYNDPAEEKPREIDVLAKRIVGNNPQFQIRLFIECKYVVNPIIFINQKRNKEKTVSLLNEMLFSGYNELQISQLNKHHYLFHNKVGKLYDISAKNPPDIIAKAINQSIHSMLSLKDVSENNTAFNRTIDYPVIIFNSFNDVHERTGNDLKNYKNIDRNFLIEVNYSKFDDKFKEFKYLLIDTLSLDTLDNFLEDDLDNDIKAYNQYFQIESNSDKVIVPKPTSYK